MRLRWFLAAPAVVLAAACGAESPAALTPASTPTVRASPVLPSVGYLGDIPGGDTWFWRVQGSGPSLAGVLYVSRESSRTCHGDYSTRQYDVTASGTDADLTLRLHAPTGADVVLAGRIAADDLEVSRTTPDGPVSGSFHRATWEDYLAADQAMAERHLGPTCP